MRKILWFSLVFCLLIASCGGESSPSPTPTPDAAFATQVAQIAPLARLTDDTVMSGGGRLLTWSPDGRELAVDAGTKIYIYSSADFTAPPRFVGTRGLNFSLAWTPDGAALATGDYDGVVALWDSTGMNNDQFFREDRLRYTPVEDIAFSSDGSRMAACAQWVRMWNLPSGELLPILEGDPVHILSVAFSPDGTLLATGGLKGEVQLWDVSTGKLKRAMKASAAQVISLAFSPDGKSLAASKRPFTVQVFDVASGSLKMTLEGPPLPADFTQSVWHNAVTFSPDGRLIASSVYVNGFAIQLWDAATGQPLRTLEAHTAPVTSIAFSPDGRMLASSGGDGTALVWSIP